MKKVGNLIAGTGLAGAILSICSYDSSPLFGLITIVGLALLYIGYQISDGYTDEEDILGSDADQKRH